MKWPAAAEALAGKKLERGRWKGEAAFHLKHYYSSFNSSKIARYISVVTPLSSIFKSV